MSTVTSALATIHVCEDTQKTFELSELLALAGVASSGALTLESLDIRLPDGTAAEGNTPLFGAIDADTIYVRPGLWAENYNGSFTTYEIIVNSGNGNLVALTLKVEIDPVNDAPLAADKTLSLADLSGVVLARSDFGFADPVEGDEFKSLVVSSLPGAGALTLNGVLVTVGQEIAAADIDAGLLVYTPVAGMIGTAEIGFQVRDDGGTAGCGGVDLSITPNYLKLILSTAEIGDRIWQDSNANGVQDAGELGIAGATVQLKDTNGNVLSTVTTDINGNYNFTVAPGTYAVNVLPLTGYKLSPANVGGDDGADSDFYVGDTGPGSSALVTVAAGDVNRTIDGGFYRTASLGDKVWVDSNGDGQQDATEAGLSGVLVKLLDASGAVVDVATTGADGSYLFADLTPGSYAVEFVAPIGYTLTQSDVGADASDSDADTLTGRTIVTELVSGENDLSWDAGVIPTGRITGTVREDLDNNDSGDTPIAGVLITLKDGSGNVLASTTTAADGSYAFNNLPAGSYTIVETNLPGYLDVSDIDGGDLNTISVSLDGGGLSAGNDFVDERLGAISGKVLEDTDNNDSGDTPIAGVTVALKDSTGAIVATTTTGADGSYSFTGVPAGTYTVVETNKPGFTDVSDTDGGDKNVIAVTLPAGGSSTGNDFVDERLGAISGTVREDLDNNDSGDTAIAGVLIGLKDGTGAVVASTTTDALGYYEFTGLPAGSYTVVETNKAGFTDVSDTDGGDKNVIAVTLPAGGSSTGNDFVDERLGAISGTVREDLDNNDSGDTAIAGVLIGLKDSTGAVVASTTTDALGYYEFTGLPAGSYTVVETNKAGFTDVSDTDGGDKNLIAVTLPAGGSSTGNDFVDERLGAISGKVLEDTDNNDSGDTPIAGVTVALKDSTGAIVATTTTGADGSYSFTGVPAGTYTVVETNKPGYTDVSDTDGGDKNVIAVTLPAGGSSTGNDFVDERLGAISGKVLEDTDNNDSGDTAIAGVLIGLKDGTGAVVASTTTDALGYYEFTGLPAGSYTVVETNKAGFTDVSDIDGGDKNSIAVTLPAGGNVPNRDFVDERLGAISGKVLEDTDNNDSGDTPIAGVTVALKDSTGAIVATTTTGADGSYSFTGVPAGTYTVVETNKAGFTDVSDTDGGDKNVIAVTLPAGGSSTGNNFVDERPLASIGNRVWYDDNANGIQDAGEKGVAGVKIELRDNVGTWGNVVATTTTDANGFYLFNNLQPGSYHIDVVEGTLPTAYQFTAANQGSDDAVDSDVVATASWPLSYGLMANTTLDAGENDLTWDAGIYKTASLGDRIWCDTDRDGVQDAGEAGFAGVTVKLLNAAGAVVASATTDASGNYLFSGLIPGQYTVQVVAPTGYDLSAKDQGANDAADSDFDTVTGKTNLITLTSGENNLSIDGGLSKKLASIGDRVWYDTDKDGVQDAGETGVAGVKIYLKNSAGTVVGSTTTDASGYYKFADLNPGDYSIQVDKATLPTGFGYVFTTKDASANSLDTTDSDVDSNGNTVKTTLVAGENDLSWDAGIYATKAKIGDRVWIDKDQDGVQDAGEVGVAKVLVKLLNNAGTVVASTTTDANGNYLFTDVAVGTYRILFDKSTSIAKGWGWTGKDMGSNDALDNDVSGTPYFYSNTGYTSYFSVKAGDAQMQWDAGVVCPLVIDLNGDGVQTVSRANSTGTFDLFGSGTAVSSGWLSGEDGFLSIDRNGNGSIDDINELFGGAAVGSGFAKLSAFDSNGDGLVNADDAEFASLSIWQDANGNHQTDAGELMTLAQAGVVSLTVGYTALPFFDANGNLHLERSSVTLDDGHTADLTDVYFNVSASDAALAGVTLPTLEELLRDDSAIDTLVGESTSVATSVADVAVAAADSGDALRKLATALAAEQALAA